MHLLILSCNTGEGHNSCAKALREYAQRQEVVCDIVDSLSFISEKTSRFIANWHSRIYRYTPSAFSLGYRYAEHHAVLFSESSPVYRLLTSGTEKLHRLIHQNGYDAILCTHVFSALQLTRLLEEHPMDIAAFFLATDYTCSPGCSRSRLDRYFIPDASLAEEFIACGIPQEKLICSGIPVRRHFYMKTEKSWAKQLCGIDPAHRHLLIMFGSMGCGPIEEIAELLTEKMPTDMEVSVVCGHNEKLFRKLQDAFSAEPRMHIYGFMKDIALMMDSADLYITKPGGISTTEAAVKGLPMALVNAVAGCESYNLRFFADRGGAVTAETTEDLIGICLTLLHNDEKLTEMTKVLGSLKAQNVAQIVFDTISDKVNRNEKKRYG